MADGPSGLQLRESHYPQRAPIDAYKGGRFRFAGMAHTGALICVPSGIYAWEREGAGLTEPRDLDRVLSEADDIDVLLVGTGTDLVPLTATVREACRAAGLVAEAMATGPAVRTYNVLLADGRRVAAALEPVDT